jgi:phenylacetate-CoA ligase
VPFVIYRDHISDATWVAAFARSRRWFGWEFGDKVAWIWGRRDEMSQSFKQRLIFWLKQEQWLHGYHPTAAMLQQYAEVLARCKPDLLAAYANVIYPFAQYLDTNKITGIRPKMMETGGMVIEPHERQLIEQVFQCPVSDRYGSHETVSPVAAECPQGRRHIFSDLCYLEFLVDGRPADPSSGPRIGGNLQNRYLTSSSSIPARASMAKVFACFAATAAASLTMTEDATGPKSSAERPIRTRPMTAL